MTNFQNSRNSSFVTIKKLAELTGYSAGALRKKIERGILAEGLHFLRAPDGRIHISLPAYHAWLQGRPTEPLSQSLGGHRHAQGN